MHDNRKLGKKLTTYLWFFLSWAPVIVMIIMIVGYFLGSQGLTTLSDLQSFKENYLTFQQTTIRNMFIGFGNYTIQPITNSLSLAFNTIGISDPISSGVIAVILSHAITWNIIHIIYDLLTMMFKVAHKYIGKIGD